MHSSSMTGNTPLYRLAYEISQEGLTGTCDDSGYFKLSFIPVPGMTFKLRASMKLGRRKPFGQRWIYGKAGREFKQESVTDMLLRIPGADSAAAKVKKN